MESPGSSVSGTKRTAWQLESPPDPPAVDAPEVDPAPSAWSELLTIVFTRRHVGEIGAYLGKCQRSPITGLVRTKDVARLPDFCLVDLLQRPSLPTSVQALASDPFLFRPVVLKNRTWFYHDDFRSRKIRINAGHGNTYLKEKHLDDMVNYAMTQRSMDNGMAVGRFSPVITFAFVGLLLCLANDMIVIAGSLAALWFQVMIAVVVNSPEAFMYERLITLPVRVAFAVWTAMRMSDFTQLGKVASAAAICALVADLVFGDVGIMLTHGLRCTYEIVRILPMQVYICRRQGGMQDAEFLETRFQVDDNVVGFSLTKLDLIIADVHGLLCELRPMQQEDWLRAAHEQMQNGTKLPYLSLGAFTVDDYGRIGPNTSSRGTSPRSKEPRQKGSKGPQAPAEVKPGVRLSSTRTSRRSYMRTSDFDRHFTRYKSTDNLLVEEVDQVEGV